MKAAFLVQTGNASQAFSIRETAIPEIKSHEVLIMVKTFGLNYADVMARNGIYASAPPLPSILGYEVVGKIAKVGSAVTKFAEGDRVVAFTRFGGYAEYCSAHESTVISLPDTVPNDSATALATQYCTAIYAAKWMANIQPGERVLIHAGAGGVGHALIQIAQQMKCEIVATAGSDAKIDYLQSLGIAKAINYSKNNFQKVLEESYGHRPVHAIFDPIGGSNFKRNYKLLSVGGRMIMFGISSFSQKKGTKLDQLVLAAQFGLLSPLQFLINSNGIIGVNMLHVADTNPQIIGYLLEEAISGYQKKEYVPKIDFSGSIEELAKAHEMLESRNTIGKLAINW